MYFIARILAHVIDLLIAFGVFYLIGMTVASKAGGLGGFGQFHVEGIPALGILGFSSLAVFLYFVLAEGFLGRTLGKAACGLKVVREDGGPCGLTASLVRNLVRVADGFLFYLVGLIALVTSKKQQRLGDMAAKTIVIRTPAVGVQIAAGIASLIAIVGLVSGALIVQKKARLASQIEIRNIRFTETEGGAPVTKTYAPGSDLYLVFDLTGVPQDDVGSRKTTVSFQPVDPAGRPIVAPVDVPITGPPSPAEETSVPAQFHLKLPIYAVGGDHIIRITAKDAVLNKQAEERASFSVVGPQIPPEAPLAIQKFVFLDKEGGTPLPEAAFAAGTKLHARFDAIGFRKSPENEVKVRVDMAVTAESGEKLLDQPGVVSIQQKFFYAPDYLPITSTLDTPPDVPLGAYRLQYLLHDDVAGTETRIEQAFLIR
jgi:uncharacterized RDD family membrane protein YckC